MKVFIHYDYGTRAYTLDNSEETITDALADPEQACYVVEMSEAIYNRYRNIREESDRLQELLNDVCLKCDASSREVSAANYAARKSGLTCQEVKTEAEKRLAKLYAGTEDREQLVKCRYCVPGWRYSIGNCVLCHWGPAPGNFGNDTALLHHELKEAFASMVN